MEELNVKVIVVGAMGCGKSSMVARFVDGSFAPTQPTAGVDFKVKTVEVRGNRIRLQIWDTAGQERAQSVTRSYYRESAAALIVYDVCDRVSFAQIPRWIQSVKEFSGNPDITLTLVGTKRDLSFSRRVSKEEGEALARDRNMAFLEVSAQTGEHLDAAFMSTAAAVARKVDQGILSLDDPSSGVRRGEKRRQNVVPDATSQMRAPGISEGGWCCT